MKDLAKRDNVIRNLEDTEYSVFLYTYQIVGKKSEITFKYIWRKRAGMGNNCRCRIANIRNTYIYANKNGYGISSIHIYIIFCGLSNRLKTR